MALQSAARARSHQLGRVEVRRVLGEAGRGRVLDALVDREDRQVAGAAQAPGAVHRGQVADHRGRAVGLAEDAVEVVGSGVDQALGRERGGLVVQQRVGFVAEKFFEVHERRA